MSFETFIRLTCTKYLALMFTCRCRFGVGVHQELNKSILYQAPSRIRERYTHAVEAIDTECMKTHMYMHTNMHSHMSMYMHLGMSVCVPVCIHVWMDGRCIIYAYTCMSVCIHVHNM